MTFVRLQDAGWAPKKMNLVESEIGRVVIRQSDNKNVGHCFKMVADVRIMKGLRDLSTSTHTI